MTNNLRIWLDALRSGKYLQGRGVLKRLTMERQTGDEVARYCCLGVGCEVAGIAQEFIRPYDKTYTFDGYASLPPGSFYAWLGFAGATGNTSLVLDWGDFWATPDHVGEYTWLDDDYSPSDLGGLTALNDDHEFTFSQIADLVEYFGVYIPGWRYLGVLTVDGLVHQK